MKADGYVPEYWHLYTSYDPEADVSCSVVVGPTRYGPDDVGEAGTVIRYVTLPAAMPGTDVFEAIPPATWCAAFTHAPTDAELDDYVPEGHRSADEIEED